MSMTIGTLAVAGDTRVTTIRFYERAGLMLAAARTSGRHRSYTNDHVRRLIFIRRARELEFSIEEIRTLLALMESMPTSCREAQHLATAHLEKIRGTIARLRKIESLLAGAVIQCSGKPLSSCPVLRLLKLS
jgi:MerR family transcriptional regulator, mercuric resistance operon regulatory protein